MNKVFVGIGLERGKHVPEKEAYQYVKEHLDDMAPEDRNELINWFFSGNWLKKEDCRNEYL